MFGHQHEPQTIPAWSSAPGRLGASAPSSPEQVRDHGLNPHLSLEATSTAGTDTDGMSIREGQPFTEAVLGATSTSPHQLEAATSDTRTSAAQVCLRSAVQAPVGGLHLESPGAVELRAPHLGSAPTSPPARGSHPSVDPVMNERSQLWTPPVRDPGSPRRNRTWRRRRTRALAQGSATRVLSVERPLSSWEPVSAGEACGYAVRFAADYLSWDEHEPARRTAALRTYLADPGMTDIGWSGHGRQRADLVTAGRTVILAQGRVVVVEVTARIVGYHRVEVAPEEIWRPPVGEATPPLAFAPASAPPPTVSGWEPGAAWWVRIAPPVCRDHDGRLVIDLSLDLSTRS